MVLLLRKLYLYFTKDPEGSIIFQGGGVSNFFQGEGQNANFFRNPCTHLLFSRGGCPDPLSPSGSGNNFSTPNDILINLHMHHHTIGIYKFHENPSIAC